MFNSKRGEGLATSTIILIILGLIVLAVLAFGFIKGWDKIKFWTTSDNNVDLISQSCSAACATQSQYDFCQKKLELKDGKDKFTDTCYNFGQKSEYAKYSIETCPAISCA